jgi:hypothetical protein
MWSPVEMAPHTVIAVRPAAASLAIGFALKPQEFDFTCMHKA